MIDDTTSPALLGGYVIRFTNGLVVYLTGDTALHADMKTVVADFHKPNAMVLNLGLSAITMASGASSRTS